MKYAFILFILVMSIFVISANTDRAKSVVMKTAQDLGWPTSTGPRDGAVGKSFQVTPNGGSDNDPSMFAAIAVAGNDQEALNALNLLQDNGMRRSTFQGRDAIIMFPGDKICSAKEGTTVDWMLKLFRSAIGYLAPLFGNDNYNPNDLCFDSYETYAWRCGKYVFMVQDQTGYGYGAEIANSLYARADEENICGMESTVVLLSAPSDVSGTRKLSHFQDITQQINTYYSYNAYGRASFTYTFFDADGSSGSNDWFVMNEPLSAYNWHKYVSDSIKNAFSKQSLEKEVYLDRIVVVHPGDGHQLGGPSNVYSACLWMDDDFNFEITDVAGQKSKVYVNNIILQSENDGMGVWAHEFGHTLYSKYLIEGKPRITDRYNYDNQPTRQFGKIFQLGLMGEGNWWGTPSASEPMHMSGFTKEATEWLRYSDITEFEKIYTVNSLENLNFNDVIYRIDDPRYTNPNFYYIIEARDSSAPYGYAESGVVIYKVGYSTRDSHHIVNVMGAQSGPKTETYGSKWYVKPTLNSLSGNGSTFISVPGRFYVSLSSESYSPYSANVYVGKYDPEKLKGAILNTIDMFKKQSWLGISFLATPDGPEMPELDLHAYDSQGRHVGMNYDTGEYENQIPGAISSGDLKDSEEWIFVPEDMEVTYTISTERVEKYLDEFPEFNSELSDLTSIVSYMKFDAEGNAYSTDEKEVKVTSNNFKIEGPDSTSLNYKDDYYPGFNNNEGEGLCCCPLFIILGILTLGLYIKYK
jgi:M6 family metalloprotease-like protein